MTVTPGQIIDHPEHGVVIVLDNDADGIATIALLDGLPTLRLFDADVEPTTAASTTTAQPAATTPADTTSPTTTDTSTPVA